MTFDAARFSWPSQVERRRRVGPSRARVRDALSLAGVHTGGSRPSCSERVREALLNRRKNLGEPFLLQRVQRRSMTTT